MQRSNIERLLINIGDRVTITINNLYYRITSEGKNRFLEIGSNKENKKGWKKLDSLIGDYCGDNNYTSTGMCIKIRVTHPFKMSSGYGNYITVHSSDVTSIEIIKKKEGTISDKISHTLVLDDSLSPN